MRPTRPTHQRAAPTVGRGWHLRLRRHARRFAPGSVAALLAVLGPGLLAGLSDDDPAGITTYSILGADYGYRLLWVLALSTAALIVFHELGARTGVVTGKGLCGSCASATAAPDAASRSARCVVANVGTICAEFAGVAAGMRAARRRRAAT